MLRRREHPCDDAAGSDTPNLELGTEETHERSPLLGHNERPTDNEATRPNSTPKSSSDKPSQERLSRDVIIAVALYCILCALVEAGSMFFYISIAQVYEDIICGKVLGSATMDGDAGDQCSSNKVVQGELATLMGWGATIGIIPGILMAIPYGVMADKLGHKVVLCLSVLGMTLSAFAKAIICWFPNFFPLRLVWAASTLELIGGGSPVLNAVLFAAVSDITPESYRSRMFFYVGSVDIAVRLVASSVTGPLMNVNVWLPIVTGLGFSVAAVAFSGFIPSTKESGKDTVSDDANSGWHDGGTNEEEHRQREQDSSSLQLLRRTIATNIQKSYSSLAVVAKGNKNMIFLLLAVMVTTVGWDAQGLFRQYARAKYGWPWSLGGYLISIKSLITILLLSVLLPALTHVMSARLGIAPQPRDLALARASCALMMTGSLVTGLSTTSAMMMTGYAIEALGGAYNLLLRSLIKTLVDDAHTALLFNAVAMLETIGSLVDSPLLAMLFRVGLNHGGSWVGLPFLVGSGLSAVAILLLCTVKL